MPAPPAEPPLDPDAAAWPFTADSPVIAGVARQDRPLAIMLVDLTGLDWPEIEPLLPVAREVAREQEMVPVLVVDLVDFRGLRGAGLAYDTLPNAAANAPLGAGDWPAYLARRRAVLLSKWQPAAIVHLGTRAEWER
ncbi:hypothetical protein [Cereibacter sphaeroides]|jgi:hypothetical protein|uniref:hypothetical protein n=1 Tax=Cereibacter sphaeroides TaxID=1063 RepID=UPI0000664CCF|nr:conserved hypothetical protein [Cereibacter sphaeroides ATCC 17029]